MVVVYLLLTASGQGRDEGMYTEFVQLFVCNVCNVQCFNKQPNRSGLLPLEKGQARAVDAVPLVDGVAVALPL